MAVTYWILNGVDHTLSANDFITDVLYKRGIFHCRLKVVALAPRAQNVPRKAYHINK